MKRKICIVTGTRADYGLLKWIIQGIKDDLDLTLQIIATGMHLSPEFGLTYRAIEEDGFDIDRKVETLISSDTPVGIAKSIGLGVIGFADALDQLEPDIVVVLGDRFEIFSAVSAALVACIPVAHLHGGETTEGAFDEALRHSITKMSHLHFVAAKPYMQRVMQLGEQPDKVFLVGGLGIDNIKQLSLLSKTELEDSINFRLGEKNLLVTFHPVTLDTESAVWQMEQLLSALEDLSDTKIIFTLPNADTDGRALIEMVKAFNEKHPNTCVHVSLGQLRYLSCLKYIDGVIGNSSSGLTEAPSFKIGTVNIGDRQLGRIQSDSVINCEPNIQSIKSAIAKLYSKHFQEGLARVENPYGNGGASMKIIDILKKCNISNIIKKRFYDYSGTKNEVFR